MAQQAVGAGVLDFLKKVFFSSLENILEGAVEYKKDMGVLKQVNTICAEEKKDKDKIHVFHVSLSPVKDQEGRFVVDITCDDIPEDELKGIRSIQGKALEINKENADEFNKLIKKFLNANKMKQMSQADTEAYLRKLSGKSGKKPKGATKEDSFECYDESKGKENAPVVTVTVKVTPWDTSSKSGKVHMEIETDAPVIKPFKGFDGSEDLIDKVIDQFLDDNVLVRTSEYDEGTATASANKMFVSLTKVTSAKHTDVMLNKIVASDVVKANSLVEMIVDSDEFVDSMPEGESFYEITDAGEDVQVDPIAAIEEDSFHPYTDVYVYCVGVCTQIAAIKFVIPDTDYSSGLRQVLDTDYMLNAVAKQAAVQMLGETSNAVPELNIMTPYIASAKYEDLMNEALRIADSASQYLSAVSINVPLISSTIQDAISTLNEASKFRNYVPEQPVAAPSTANVPIPTCN